MATLVSVPERSLHNSGTASKPSTWLALLISLGALNGSLYLSLGMGLKACPLCLYQRTFIMGVVAILFVGLMGGNFRQGSLSLLALPLALAGMLIAGLHVYLEKTGALECPGGLWELGKAPDQSLVVHVLLFAVLLWDLLGQRAPYFATICAAFIGVGLAFFAVKSAPPPPKVPAQGWETPLEKDGCRPPAIQVPQAER